VSLRPLAAVLAVSVLALTGCGVADGGGLQAGQAAQINDETISASEVDDAAQGICGLIRSSASQEGTVLSGAQLRTIAEQGIALQVMGRQMLEAYDVSLPATADDGEAALAQNYPDADPDVLEAAAPALTGSQYFNNVLVALGQDEAGATAGQEEIIAAGVQRAQDWQADADIETNPRFTSLEIGDDQIISERDSLSVAVSTFAKAASEAEQPEGFADALPASQRCSV
jgi:hypothetical protein